MNKNNDDDDFFQLINEISNMKINKQNKNINENSTYNTYSNFTLKQTTFIVKNNITLKEKNITPFYF